MKGYHQLPCSHVPISQFPKKKHKIPTTYTHKTNARPLPPEVPIQTFP